MKKQAQRLSHASTVQFTRKARFYRNREFNLNAITPNYCDLISNKEKETYFP